MLSAKNISVIKIAIEICNNSELKRKILCVSGDEIVEKKAVVMVENLGLPKELQREVIGIVLLVGMKMLTWAEYHEVNLGLSREYSISFLSSSFFTSQGIIDNKRAAEGLMKDDNLSIIQKYKLACLYCFTEHIPTLYKQLTKEEKELFYDAQKPIEIKQQELVKFWSYYLMGEIDKLKGEKSLDQYRVEKAVESGSKAAVEYCLEKTNLRRKESAIIDAAIETVKNRIIREPRSNGNMFDDNGNEWVFFDIVIGEESWIPSDYYVDILHFLLSKMRDDQKIEFLKRDIEGVDYKKFPFKNHRHSRTLEYFLNWPYQSYFMKTAELMWEILPERSYADLLLAICNKIESKRERILKCGEEKSFDYRDLLKEFWLQSPKHYKRYVFSDKNITYKNGFIDKLKEGKELLTEIFKLKDFTYKDRQNIELILASATDKEKENIIFSQEGKNICIGLMEEGKWRILNEFVPNCFASKEQADEFKKEFSFMKEIKRICIDFVKNDKWDAAESFMKWSALPEELINKLKKEMIYSEYGRDACLGLISYNKKVKAVDEFIRWCFSSEEEVKAFKEELAFSDKGIYKCENLVIGEEFELTDEFISLCLSSTEEIRELKEIVAYRTASYVCKKLISDYSEEDIYDEQGYYVIGRTTKFKGGKWEEVEKFLTWCFSSEEEISDFKKNMLLELSGQEIHFNLIKSNQWEEAETFFAWLGLSAEEIKKLKKGTLFHYFRAREMFSELMYSKEDDERFVDYGSKQEAIELLLGWYLTDKGAVLEFKNEFKRGYCGEVTEKCKTMFENFDLAIEKRLNDLEEEQRGKKRKSETFSPSKMLCNLKL